MPGKRAEFRVERDALGEVQIPASAYWGLWTARVAELSFERSLQNNKLIEALLLVKKAAVMSSIQSGVLEIRVGNVILQVIDEMLGGQWRDQILVNLFQPAAVVGLIANLHEVVASRGMEILSLLTPSVNEKIDPDRHIGLAQSANDVFSAALRIALLWQKKRLEMAILDLERLLRRKALEFDKIVKARRVDQESCSLGQVFNSYGAAVERCHRRVIESGAALLELNLGGVQLGNSSECSPSMIDRLADWSGLRLRATDDSIRFNQSMSDFTIMSSSLKELSVELNRIASDLLLMSVSGVAEITLPAVVQAPDIVSGAFGLRASIAESMSMVALVVIGNDSIICTASQSGRVDANPLVPLIAEKLLESTELLLQAINLFNKNCVAGIRANLEKIEASVPGALALEPPLSIESVRY